MVDVSAAEAMTDDMVEQMLKTDDIESSLGFRKLYSKVFQEVANPRLK